MGTKTGAILAMPVPPRPVVTTCPCGASYTGHEGEKWFQEHQKSEHPEAFIDFAKRIVQTAMESNDKDFPKAACTAIEALAEFLGISA